MADNSNFDTAAFAALLEKAKGDRSINQYADDIDVSAAHISRLLRCLVKAPPSPDTISKFAKGAHNGVQYNELMIAAGHINEIEDKDPLEGIKKHMIETEKKFFQIILSDLYTRDIEWTMNKAKNGSFDLVIEISGWEYSKWYFDINPIVTQHTVYNVYGHIASIELSQDIKLSIAVASEREFNLFVNKPPKSLKANLYVMLVDLNAGRIVKEERLCRY